MCQLGDLRSDDGGNRFLGRAKEAWRMDGTGITGVSRDEKRLCGIRCREKRLH